MDQTYPYIASLTREPFLFYEMRSTAKLMAEGNSDDAIVKEIVEQNLFQYPTEKSISRMAKACIKRLYALEDASLVSAIASQPTDVAKQICLYALMKQSRLVWEFMLTVIGEKYRLRDTSFGKIVHVHLNIIPDHFFKNTRYTHTHQTNVWLHFCLIFCK